MLGNFAGIFSGLVHSSACRAILVQPCLIAQELQAVGKVVRSTRSLRDMRTSRTKMSKTITNNSRHVKQQAPHRKDFAPHVLTSLTSAWPSPPPSSPTTSISIATSRYTSSPSLPSAAALLRFHQLYATCYPNVTTAKRKPIKWKCIMELVIRQTVEIVNTSNCKHILVLDRFENIISKYKLN